ncbi:MAG TPA: hypothetical protein PLE60_09540 [Candidatus Latescibacteria bacterium]|nr:hypothetical protein [Candidatus Latescibacterota bacterium]
MKTALEPQSLSLAFLSDRELVSSMRNDSEGAWRVILQRYTPMLLAAARTYARTCASRDRPGALADIASDLYLFMAERVRASLLRFYRGECEVRTWIYRIIGDRRQIIRSFMARADETRWRADTRLPKLMQDRPRIEQEVYRRLVWGKDALWIAQDLGMTETKAHELCETLLETLARKSPRVYQRIMANRKALLRPVPIEAPQLRDDKECAAQELRDASPLPDETAENVALNRLLSGLQDVVAGFVKSLPEADARLLILVFDAGWSLTEIAERAELLGLPGLSARHQVDYRINRALGHVAQRLCEHYGRWRDDTLPTPSVAVVTAALKAFLRETGVAGFASAWKSGERSKYAHVFQPALDGNPPFPISGTKTQGP